MATIRTYFRDVFTIEERVKDRIMLLVGSFGVEDVVLDPVGSLELLIAACSFVLREELTEAVNAGRRFAGSIVDHGITADAAIAIEQGIAVFESRALQAATQFLADVTATIESQERAGISPENIAIREVLLASVRKRIVDAAENVVQLVANTTMQQAVSEVDDEFDAEEEWTWVTVHDTRVCPDCNPRHNVTRTLREWIEVGLPKSGWSVCDDRCRCVILPKTYADDDIDFTSPVKLTKRDLAQFGTRVEDLVP